jgi:hypothetical protein
VLIVVGSSRLLLAGRNSLSSIIRSSAFRTIGPDPRVQLNALEVLITKLIYHVVPSYSRTRLERPFLLLVPLGCYHSRVAVGSPRLICSRMHVKTVHGDPPNRKVVELVRGS